MRIRSSINIGMDNTYSHSRKTITEITTKKKVRIMVKSGFLESRLGLNDRILSMTFFTGRGLSLWGFFHCCGVFFLWGFLFLWSYFRSFFMNINTSHFSKDGIKKDCAVITIIYNTIAFPGGILVQGRRDFCGRASLQENSSSRSMVMTGLSWHLLLILNVQCMIISYWHVWKLK